MEISIHWPQILIYLCPIIWTIVHVSGQKYYINLHRKGPYEGTIEMSDGISWYVVPSQGWNDKNAAVACRMLGYTGNKARASFDYRLPELSRPLWSFQFLCNGNETSLSDCDTIELSENNSSVGVNCELSQDSSGNNILVQQTSTGQLSNTNVLTMNGIIDIRSSCFPRKHFVYDPKYNHFLFMKDSSILGCGFLYPEYTIYTFEQTMSTLTKYDFDSEDSLMFYIGVDGISKLNPYDYNSKPISVLNITKGSIILALDTLNKYVYWANSFEVRIMRVTYDGSRVMNFASMSNGAIAGFAFSAKTVFWKDTRMEGISRSLGNGAGLTTLYRGVPGCTDLYILGEWLWCTSDFGVIRLEQYGKCGGYFGPFHELNQQFKGYIFNGNLENTCQNVYINIYGVKPNEGQVSISNGIDWHPLCADGWDDADAAVACRMLGYSGEDAKATFNISVSAYSNWPFQFDCNGDESELSRCNISDSSTLDCYRAELLCSEHKVVEDFFLKRGMHDWSFTLSITNPWTMSGYINTNNPCNDIYGFYGSDVEVVYDYVTQQFLTLQSETLWGCRWSEGIREIRPNVTELRYSAVDSEDRLLFGYMGNAIVSLELDNVFSGFVIVVNKTSVGKKMILDTERNELYWWESNTCILKRICYPGCLEVVDVLSTSSTFRKFTFNGEYIFAIDSVQRGLIRINRNTSVQDKLYEAYGVMTDCTNLYANEEWIYCTGYRSLGVIRLKADGTGGSFHGPIEFSWTAYHSSVIFYHRSRSPGHQQIYDRTNRRNVDDIT